MIVAAKHVLPAVRLAKSHSRVERDTVPWQVLTKATLNTSFTPLVQEFVREVDLLPHINTKGMPQPLLPLFGSGYERSALKLVIVGQDTKKWGDLNDFIAAEKKKPGSTLRADLDEFRGRGFVKWGPRRQNFWGFVMMTLAALYGHADWGVMKHGKLTEILNSFGWAETNAVELYGSTARGLGVPENYWSEVRKAADNFNRIRHIIETLRPNAVLILNKGLNMQPYFEGYRLETIEKVGRMTHYRLPEVGVEVFHGPHPGSMNRIEGTGFFLDEIMKLLADRKLTAKFPLFTDGRDQVADTTDYLLKNAPPLSPSFDKYDFVAWVAEELAKREVFMSVPTLVDLLNNPGGKTNYGKAFEGGRGSYRLVSGTYYRLERAGKNDAAKVVAQAFRKPNFEYAYSLE